MDWQNAIFGPGWVWSLLSLVLVVGSLVGLYRQLRLQSSANAWAQLGEIQREGDSERMTRYKLDVLEARRERSDPADLPPAAASTVADYWERVAILVRRGHVDRDLLYQQAGLSCQRWWGVLGPFIRGTRVQHGHPKIGQNFEWLAREFEGVTRREGKVIAFDDAYFMSALDGMIAGCREDIRIWRELRGAATPLEAAPAEPLPGAGTSAPGLPTPSRREAPRRRRKASA